MMTQPPGPRSTDPKALVSALEGLGNMDLWDWSDEACQAVIKALDDPDAAVRGKAVKMVAPLVDDRVALKLLQLRHDPHPEIAADALMALGPTLELCDEEGDDFSLSEPPLSLQVVAKVQHTLERTYRDASVNKLVRRRALEAAVHRPAPWQQGAARAALASQDHEWMLTALFAAGYLPGLEDALVPYLHSTHEELLAMALISAGRCDQVAAGPRALELATDPHASDKLRLAAIEALAGLDYPPAQEALLELAQEDGELGELARWALEERKLLFMDGPSDELDLS